MTRWRYVLGMIVGVILILSSGAHSILGWKGLGAELAKTNAPATLVTNLEIGWLWGGAAILIFGIMVIVAFRERARHPGASLRPMLILGIAYTAFGVWAIVRSASLFFLIFVVPGVMLIAAAWPDRIGKQGQTGSLGNSRILPD